MIDADHYTLLYEEIWLKKQIIPLTIISPRLSVFTIKWSLDKSLISAVLIYIRHLDSICFTFSSTPSYFIFCLLCSFLLFHLIYTFYIRSNIEFIMLCLSCALFHIYFAFYLSCFASLSCYEYTIFLQHST